MKKIIYFTAFCFSVAACKAQSITSIIPSNVKTLTSAEANLLNPTAEPTIDGIPYSQYKTAQDALKKQAVQADAKAKQTTNVPSPNLPTAAPQVAPKKKNEIPKTIPQK